jgi:hypothetical protein
MVAPRWCGRDDHSGRQRFRTEERAEGEPDVARERGRSVVPAAVPHAPHLVAHGWHVTELDQRRAPRDFRILAAFNPLRDADRDVPADLILDLAFIRSHVGSFEPVAHPPRSLVRERP